MSELGTAVLFPFQVNRLSLVGGKRSVGGSQEAEPGC